MSNKLKYTLATRRRAITLTLAVVVEGWNEATTAGVSHAVPGV